jgi:CRISPR-associated endonuclease Csn1
MDPADWPQPPNRAVQGGTNEDAWPTMDATFSFRFSLYPLSLVQLVKPDGEIVEGYMRSLDRTTGAVTLSGMASKTLIRKGIGLRTLLSFRKFQVDRLGRRFEIVSEQRTWHGVACK